MAKTLFEELADTATHLRQIRKAVTGRGGELSATAGMKDLPSAIFNIPADSSLAYYTDEASAYKKIVPSGAEDYAQLKSVGGITRVVPGVNHIPNADVNGIGASTQVNYEESSIFSFGSLAKGKYRYYCKAMPTVEDDCVSVSTWLYFSDDADNLYSAPFIAEGGLFESSGNTYCLVKCGSGINYSVEPNITVTQVGGDDDGATIVLGTEETIWIGGGSYCDIKISTNTRVKVIVSSRFESREETEFVVGKGEYTYEWRNTGTEVISYTIKVEHYIPDMEYIGVTLYPMVYAVPDDSPEYIRTEYEPYDGHLVPTPVTEIVSKGANLIPYPYFSKGTNTNGVTFVVNDDGSVLINGTATANINWVFKQIITPVMLVKGKTYTVSGGSADAVVYIQDTSYKQTSTDTFTAKYESYYMWVGISSGKTFDNVVIKPMLNEGDSPAPYKPYIAEPIDTVSIPDAVKNDAGWGHNIAYVRSGTSRTISNVYDFSTKTYTKYIHKIIVLDGVTDGCKFTSASPNNGFVRMVYPLDGECYDTPTIMATGFKNAYADAIGNVYMIKNNAYFFLPSEIKTVAEANAWLAENPVEVIYALKEPTVTTIEETSEKFIEVEGGGEIVFENEAKADVPSSIKYVRKV